MTQTLKKLRPLLLSLLIFALVASGTPLPQSFAKWGRSPYAARRKKQKRYRRHSRAWWRRHRARLRARRERVERRRLQRLAALKARNSLTGTASFARPVNTGGANSAVAVNAPRLPFDLRIPHTWAGGQQTPTGEVTFAMRTPEGRAAGTAVFAEVAVTRTDDAVSARTKLVGGATITALRRTVIDRMLSEGGWVVNDMVREIGGRRVFVVVAQTGTPGAPSKSWTFYFTEIEGRVYSLATASPVEFAAPVAAGSEQVLASLRRATVRSLASQQ